MYRDEWAVIVCTRPNILLGRCDAPHYGDSCQYSEECSKDKVEQQNMFSVVTAEQDCGRFGRCVDTEATSAPRFKCFCQKGFFGPKCRQQSTITKSVSIKDFN